MKGIIIENSLVDKDILKSFVIDKKWQDGDWTLYAVQITEDQTVKLAESLNDGPWYTHFWEPGKDQMLVVFKGKIFTISANDKATWESVIAYGKSIGIPEEQLDFPTD